MAKKKEVKEEEGKVKGVESLDVVKKAIEKKFGNVLKPMSERPLVIDTISTRSLGLDLALGRGGIALGRIYECYGEPSSGKSTLAMSVVAEAQSRGMSALWVDAEHSADPVLFENMGIQLDKLQVVSAHTGEKNLMVVEELMKTGMLDIVVIDSVTSLIPSVMAEGDLDQDTMALLARLMSKTLLRFVPIASETNTCIIFINQTRMKIGGYGNPETTSGGTSLGFYSTGRIRVSGIGNKSNRIVGSDGKLIGHKTTFEVVKSKLSIPFTVSTVDLIYGKGFDTQGEVITLATELGILEKAGSWYKYNDQSIGQGENGAKNFFNENSDIYGIVKDEVTISLGLDKYYKLQKEYDLTRIN